MWGLPLENRAAGGELDRERVELGALGLLDYQWNLLEELRRNEREAADLDVKVALSCISKNSSSLQPSWCSEFLKRTGVTNMVFDFDTWRLFWQWVDPVAVIQSRPVVFHAAAKDIHIRGQDHSCAASSTTTSRAGAGRTAHNLRRRRVGQRVAEDGIRTGARHTGTTPIYLVDVAFRLLRGRSGHAREHRARGRHLSHIEGLEVASGVYAELAHRPQGIAGGGR